MLNDCRMVFGKWPRLTPVVALCCAVSLPACTAATAAGCGSGILAGVALGLVSLVAAGDQVTSTNNSGAEASTGSLAGPIMLGSAMFGAAAGCTAAAVTDRVARADERSHRRHALEAVMPSRYPRLAAAASGTPNGTRTDLDGISLFWSTGNASEVRLQLQRLARTPSTGDCEQVEWQLGDRTLRFGTSHAMVPSRTAVTLHRGEAKLDITTVNEIIQTQPVSMRWCGQQRTVTVAARDALRGFLRTHETARANPGPSEP